MELLADQECRLTAATLFERKVEPLADDWHSFAFANGVFDTARRELTAEVEGTIYTPQHLVMITLDGGCEHEEVVASCGHTYVGADRPGAVSFVPAHCERRMKLRQVRSSWASVSIDPFIVERAAGGPATLEGATFTNGEDPFLGALVTDFAQAHRADGGLDRSYCDAMSWALAHYLLRRYSRPGAQMARRHRLPAWRLKRLTDYMEAHLDRELRIADLAEIVGLSPGHLHRAFRETTGCTPLAFLNERRIERAKRILAAEELSIAELALRIGFSSPSHFSRLFRTATGLNPSAYRTLRQG